MYLSCDWTYDMGILSEDQKCMYLRYALRKKIKNIIKNLKFTFNV
jgi:hypothetical protein